MCFLRVDVASLCYAKAMIEFGEEEFYIFMVYYCRFIVDVHEYLCKAAKSIIPPLPHSSHSFARDFCFLKMGIRALVRTMAAKVVERGQPCVTPSFMLMIFQLLVFHLYFTAPGSL